MSKGRDTRTLDLLSWEPPKLVRRFEEKRVRAANLRDRIALAVAETLKECGMSREDVARRMSDWLGEDVSKNVLDRWASQASDDHTPSFLRVLALVQATGDIRLLQLGADLFGQSVVENRYLPWVAVGQLADKKEEIDRTFDVARRMAKKGVMP